MVARWAAVIAVGIVSAVLLSCGRTDTTARQGAAGVSPGVRVVGVYAVEDAPEPCYLIELEVDAKRPFDLGRVTQRVPGSPQSDCQVPWKEALLTPDGLEAREWPRELTGHFRIAFYFHYLALDQPLLTPEGRVALTKPQAKPARLGFMSYEPPE